MTRSTRSPRLGTTIPQTDIGGDPGAMRAYAQAAEQLGFDHLVIYGTVLNANPNPGDSGSDGAKHYVSRPIYFVGLPGCLHQTD